MKNTFSSGNGKPAVIFEKAVKEVLENIFGKENIRFQIPYDSNSERADIMISNHIEGYIFNQWIKNLQYKINLIPVEVKNKIPSNINADINQLNGYLQSGAIGDLGFVIYRDYGNKKDFVVKKCKNFFNNQKKIILSFSYGELLDIEKLNIKQRNKFLEQKFLQVTLF